MKKKKVGFQISSRNASSFRSDLNKSRSASRRNSNSSSMIKKDLTIKIEGQEEDDLELIDVFKLKCLCLLVCRGTARYKAE